MRKTAIVLEVSRIRSQTPVNEKQILKELSTVLINLSVDLHEWDMLVDNDLAQGIIRHVSAVKGRLSMADLVTDVDLLIRRTAAAATVAELNPQR